VGRPCPARKLGLMSVVSCGFAAGACGADNPVRADSASRRKRNRGQIPAPARISQRKPAITPHLTAPTGKPPASQPGNGHIVRPPSKAAVSSAAVRSAVERPCWKRLRTSDLDRLAVTAPSLVGRLNDVRQALDIPVCESSAITMARTGHLGFQDAAARRDSCADMRPDPPEVMSSKISSSTCLVAEGLSLSVWICGGAHTCLARVRGRLCWLGAITSLSAST
jgi:hypothetical protein